MNPRFVTVTCPSCFQQFQMAVPPPGELPAELDYDCEVCCRPMVIYIAGEDGDIHADASGIGD